MSAPPEGTVLQVQCGSCLKIVNVPAEYLDQLLLYKMYSCPHCKSRQQIQLTAQQETSLRIQAKQILSAAAQQQQQQQQRESAAAAAQQQRQAAAAQLAAYTQALAAAAAAGAAPRPQAQAAAPTPADMLGRLVAAVQQQQQAAARPPPPAQPAAAPHPPAPAPRPAAAATAVQLLQRQMAAMVAAAGAAQQRLQNAALTAAANTAAAQQQQQQQQQQQVQVPPALLEALRRAQQLQVEQARQQQAAAQAAQQAGGQGGQPEQQAVELAQLAQQQQQLLELAQQQLAQQLAQQLLEPLPDDLDDADDSEVRETFMAYAPAKLPFGQPHPDSVVETASLAAVEPPDITYQLKAHDQLLSSLSALQLESVVYACQRHQQLLPDGSRAGFFIGDGAGVGKGRTVAGLILENWVQGRHKHLWLSVGADLKIDTNRDLADVGAGHLPLYALNKLPYGKLAGAKIGVKEGVMFLTYSSLTSSSDRGHTRFRQLVDWCGKDFDGLIIFDESHKAKNLVPEGGTRPTQVGIKVRELQAQLPKARVVYCSATGASEPRNMAYMTRLHLWGEGNPAFKNFSAFLEAVQPKGSGSSSGSSMAALELVAMDMKAQGMFVCRTLSFAGAEFQTVEAPLEEPIASQYCAATTAWSQLFREFLQAEERAAAAGLAFDARATWRAFWAAHQAFFRHMTMAAKVPAIVRMARAALASGKCAVIGLQSTGEARTADVVAEKGEQLDDFVSGPKELLLRLVDLHFPLPPDPDAPEDEDGSDSDFDVAAVTEAAARNKLGGRDQAYRGAKARQIRYREFSESEDIGATASSSSDSESDSGGYVSGSSSSSSSSSEEEEGEEEGEEEEEEEEEGARAVRKQQNGVGKRSGAASPTPSSASEGKQANGSGKQAGAEADARSLRARQRESRRVSQQKKERSLSSSGSESDDEASSSGGSRGGRARARTGRRSSSAAAGSQDAASGSKGGRSGSRAATREGSREQQAVQGQAAEGSGEQAQQDDAQQEEAQRAQQEEAQRAKREHAEAAYREALGRKELLLALVQQLELPSNPLDSLIDQLGGPSQVAEMTGRKGRLVRSGEGGTGVVYEARNASGVDAGSTLEMINVHERELFLSGQKLVAIISEAASAGISLHADRRCANQRRRLHLTLELPWSADRAIQQFGRTHRANQAHGPQYRLVFTPLGGERRFAAAVARRLESLGALTQGDRRAGPSLAAFNFDSSWGQRALRETYRAIMGEERAPLALPQACRPGPDGEPPAMSQEAFMARARALLLNVGVIRHNRGSVAASQLGEFLSRPEGAPTSVGRIAEADMADVPRFLNRLLGLDPEAQAILFDFYSAVLDALMDRARREGTLDEGIVDIRARGVSLAGEPQVLLRDAATGAAAVLHEVELDRGLPWADAQQLLEQHQQEAAAAAAGLASPPAGLPAVLASVPAPQQEAVDEQQEQAAGEEKEACPELEQPEAGGSGLVQPPTAAVADGGMEQLAEQQAGGASAAVKQEGAAEQQQQQQQQQQQVKEEPGGSQQDPQQPSRSEASDGSPQSGCSPGSDDQQQAASVPAAASGKRRQPEGEADDGAAAAAADGKDADGCEGRKRQRIGSPGAAGVAAGPAGAAAGEDASQRDQSVADQAGAGSEQPQAGTAAEAAEDVKPEQGSEASTREKPQRSRKRGGTKGGGSGSSGSSSGSGSDSDEVVEVTEEELQKQGGAPAARRRWVSGFYRAKAEGINRQVHVLLALEVPGSEPPTFVVHRPATGRSRQTLSLQELRSRYRPLQPAACQPLWERAFEAADATDPKERPGAVARKRRLHILGGAVMRCWGTVQDVLARHATESERRVRVVRIATTGEEPQRLVGMLIPEPAVDEVVAALSSRSGEGSGGGAAAEQALAAGSGQASEQAEGSEGDDQAGAVGSPAKGSTPRAAKAAGEVGSPKAGSGRRHHRRRHQRGDEQRQEGEAGVGSGGEDRPSPKRKRHSRKGAKSGQSEPSDRGGGGSGGEDLPSPKRKRHGRKGAKASQPKASDRSGGSGSGGEDLPSSKRKRRQKEEAQPRRMPPRSGRPASMKG